MTQSEYRYWYRRFVSDLEGAVCYFEERLTNESGEYLDARLDAIKDAVADARAHLDEIDEE